MKKPDEAEHRDPTELSARVLQKRSATQLGRASVLFLLIVLLVFLFGKWVRALSSGKAGTGPPSAPQMLAVAQIQGFASETTSDADRRNESGGNTKEDLASSAAAHTSQLTLISVFLGVIVGALASLPHEVVFHVWEWNHLALDLRILATILAALDFWMKYSWGVIVVRWPFSISHHIIYTLLCLAMLGMSLSVTDIHGWLAWGVITCFAAFLAYMQNLFAVIWEKRHRATTIQKDIITEDPPFTPKELKLLRSSSLLEAALILLPPAVLVLSSLFNDPHVPFYWLFGRLPFFSTLGWGGFITGFVLLDILYQGVLVMPKQRYGQSTTSGGAYTYGDRRED